MKIVCVRALHTKVLCVAVERFDGWCAYVAPVEGKNHNEEAQLVMERGTKLLQEVAEAIFGGAMVEDFAERRLKYVK